MPRFVILTHDHPFLHWDLLLEQGETLRSWRLLKEPAHNQSIEAEPLPAHRKMYLDYEGPVSGERGTVKQWDRGEYEMISEEETELQFQLNGEKLTGQVRMFEEGEKWIFLLNEF